MPLNEPHRTRMLGRLQQLYGGSAEEILGRIDRLADRYAPLRDVDRGPAWDERSVVLITYADQLREDGRVPLAALERFLLDYGLDKLISTVHLLPFFPFSSDDGFSVIDYRRVDPEIGDWSDIARLGRSFRLMLDFVVNHCSQQNEWFQRYLHGEAPYTNYFLEMDPAADLSAVTRPRSTPLLTAYPTRRGTKHVWTTFSADQVDLNFACPDVLVAMLDILLQYVQQGAAVIRLDAIGFLWKKIGTTCMHLPETHAVVKLMRDLVDDVAPGTVLLTETNVPHEENISYFGAGDEAQMVYQFSLAPLLLDALLTGDAGLLSRWLGALDDLGPGRTFFNFTASHDGIGLRPLEGIVAPERLDDLVQNVCERGGVVSMRRGSDGRDVPYELNVTFFSALDAPAGQLADVRARRFLTSQAVMLALRGVPGIYFHSLVGTPNDTEAVERTGQPRAINRRKFALDELQQILGDPARIQRRILDGYRRMLAVRAGQPAFHPEAAQRVIHTDHKSLLAFSRESRDTGQQIVVVANFGAAPAHVDLDHLGNRRPQRDLLSGQPVRGTHLALAPWDTVWLE